MTNEASRAGVLSAGKTVLPVEGAAGYGCLGARGGGGGGNADLKSQGVMCGLFKQPLGGREGGRREAVRGVQGSALFLSLTRTLAVFLLFYFFYFFNPTDLNRHFFSFFVVFFFLPFCLSADRTSGCCNIFQLMRIQIPGLRHHLHNISHDL